MDQYHLHDDHDDECLEYDEKDNDDDNSMITTVLYVIVHMWSCINWSF